MALDPTASELNFNRSIKKYFVDNLETVEGLCLIFDRDWTHIPEDGSNKWVAFDVGELTAGSVFERMVRLFCCTRDDTEGEDLLALRDAVMGYLTDTTEGTRRIPLYNSSWTQIGSMLVYLDSESGIIRADDGTKYKILSITLKWGAKI